MTNRTEYTRAQQAVKKAWRTGMPALVSLLLGAMSACVAEPPQTSSTPIDSTHVITARLDTAWRQCDLRARAGAGSYSATYQLCLQDHYGFPERGAHRLTEAMVAYRALHRSLRDATFARHVWPDFRNYRGLLRGAAAVLEADPAWADSLVRLDSVPLAQRDSSEQAARRAFDREVQDILGQWRREREQQERQDSLLRR